MEYSLPSLSAWSSRSSTRTPSQSASNAGPELSLEVLMETARRQFRDDLEAEIVRLLNEEHEVHMLRETVEEIGRKSGVNPTEATRLFINLRGVVWAGTFSRSSDSEHPGTWRSSTCPGFTAACARIDRRARLRA